MIAVTGATGFVGRGIARAASSAGIPVLGLSRQVESWGGELTRAVGDLSLTPLDPRLLDGVTCVIHAAARAHVFRESSPAPDELFQAANINAALQVARAAVASGVARMVHVSSIGVLGEETTNHPFRPTDPHRPQGSYARSKSTAELELTELAQCGGLELVIVRPPLVYGPGAPGNLAAMISWLRRGIPLPLGAIKNRRSLVDVDSLGRFLLSAGSHPGSPTGTFHVADEMPLSTPEIVRAVATGMGRSARLFPVPLPILRAAGSLIGRNGRSGRSASISRLCQSLEVDITDSIGAFGWTPVADPTPGLSAMSAATLR